ncbi:Uncharacterised protein [Candidatus Burarchaeum australiense]|nr:Uncharacterised protein [Candidatus Burarchaeum australiense]
MYLKFWRPKRIMADCEICGREGAGYVVQLEGARMRTCAECAKGGKILERPAYEPPKRAQAAGAGRMGGAAMAPQVRRGPQELEIATDFSERIVAARQHMHIERKVLAEMVSEKESFLERVEHGNAQPGEVLARKLEKALGIKLLGQDAGESYGSAPMDKRKDLTLGDIVFVKKKKSEEE